MTKALVLAGSFFPVHEGHIDLLQVAKKHIGQDLQCILCVTSVKSLTKKMGHVTLEQLQVRQKLLEDMQQKYAWLRVMHCKLGVRETIKQLQQDHTVYQVCGVDSKIQFAKDNPHAIIVHDGRSVPERNKSVLKSNVTVIPWRGKGLSSTMVRFIIGAPFRAETFCPEWLRDTGYCLGQGAQGIVQLMKLGDFEVAVKFLDLRTSRDQEQFKVVQRIWNVLDSPQFRCYFAGHLNENVGIIVTDVGVSLSSVFNLQFAYKNNGCAASKEFLQNTIHTFPLDKHTQITQEFKVTKEEVICGLWEALDRLKSKNVLHRDIKCDNILLVRKNGQLSVQLCDYGVAKFSHENFCCPRGSLRYYPAKAIEDRHFYTHECDRFMAAFVVYELICEKDACSSPRKRKNGVFPKWTTKQYLHHQKTVENIWKSSSLQHFFTQFVKHAT